MHTAPAPLPVRILSADINDPPYAAGTLRFLLHFTAQVGPFMFVGAGLALPAEGDGKLVVILPGSGRTRRSVITDGAMRRAIKDAAIAAYQGLGGSQIHLAAPPLATAPDMTESQSDDPSQPS
jgi:hypothetical protein